MTSSILSPQAFDIVAIDFHARSSFRFAMAALPPAQRRAAKTVYAYCRVIDDIADSDMSADANCAFGGLACGPLRLAARHGNQIRRSDGRRPHFGHPGARRLRTLLDGMIADAAAPPTIHTLDVMRLLRARFSAGG